MQPGPKKDADKPARTDYTTYCIQNRQHMHHSKQTDKSGNNLRSQPATAPHSNKQSCPENQETMDYFRLNLRHPRPATDMHMSLLVTV